MKRAHRFRATVPTANMTDVVPPYGRVDRALRPENLPARFAPSAEIAEALKRKPRADLTHAERQWLAQLRAWKRAQHRG